MKKYFGYLSFSLIPAAPLLLLYACAGITPQSADQATFAAVSYTCASATAALKTAIKLNDRLTPDNRANVTRAGQTLNPVCSQDPVPTVSTTAKAALDAALLQLTVAAAQAQQ